MEWSTNYSPFNTGFQSQGFGMSDVSVPMQEFAPNRPQVVRQGAVTDEILIDTGKLELPGPGSTRIVETFTQIPDDLSGINLSILLSKGIVAQQRTNVGATKKKDKVQSNKFVGKPFAFMLNKYFIKGPYVMPEKRSKEFMNEQYPHALQNVIDRSRIMMKLGNTLLLIPLVVLSSSDGYFLVFQNLNAGIRLKISRFTEKQTGITYNLADRSQIIKAKDAILNSSVRERMQQYMRQLLIDLVVLYGLNVGDMNLSNILVNERNGKVYIIDIDNDRSGSARDDFNNQSKRFYFNYGANKMGSNLAIAWDEMVAPVIQDVIVSVRGMGDAFIQLGFSQTTMDRLMIGITLLEMLSTEITRRVERKEGWPNQKGDTEEIAMYAKPIQPYIPQYSHQPSTVGIYNEFIPETSSRSQTGISLVHRNAPTQQSQNFSTEGTYYSPQFSDLWIAPPEQQQSKMPSVDLAAVSSTAPIGYNVPLIQPPPLNKMLGTENIKNYGPVGGMRVVVGSSGKKNRTDNYFTYSSGMNTEIYGIPASSLFTIKMMKSALQKYIRRGDVDKACMAATELWRMHEISVSTGPISLMKRLRVIAVEDIGPANQNLVASVIVYANIWENAIKKNREDVENNVRFHEVLFVVQEMCKSLKTRVCSHIWKTYTVGADIALNYGITKVDSNRYEEEFNAIDRKFLDPILNEYFLPEDPRELWITGTLFMLNFTHRQYYAITWLDKYMKFAFDDGLKVKARKGGRTNPIYVIFSMFDSYFGASTQEYMKALAETDTKQQRPYIQYLVVCGLLQIQLGTASQIPAQEASKIDSRHYLQGEYTFDLDEYVIRDIHSGRTKWDAEGKRRFVEEGAYVANEDMKFRFGPYYDIYMLASGAELQ